MFNWNKKKSNPDPVVSINGELIQLTLRGKTVLLSESQASNLWGELGAKLKKLRKLNQID